MKMKKMKQIVLLSILTVMIATTGCWTQKTEKKYDPFLDEVLKNYPDCPDKKEPMRDYLPSKMFCELPKMPEDFKNVQVVVEYGKLHDLTQIDEEYWKQPEFFPNFEQMALPTLQQPPKDRIGVTLPNIYPADTVVTASAGDTVLVATIVKASPLGAFYVGLAPKAVYATTQSIPKGKTFSNGNITVVQDPDIVKNYFDVTFDPEVFLLEPSFPVFKYNSSHMIKVLVNIHNDTPVGMYVVGMDFTSPPYNIDQKWLVTYLTEYTSGVSYGIGRPWYNIFIEVERADT